MQELNERLGERGAAWVVGSGVLLLAMIIGWIVGVLLHRALAAAARKSEATWDDALVARLRRPLAIVPAVMAGWLALPALPLTPAAARISATGLNVLTTLVVIWMAFRFVDVARLTLSNRSWAKDRPATLSLLAMGVAVLVAHALLWAGLASGHLPLAGWSLALIQATAGVGVAAPR